ncbi:MAG TPA: hypothetical protein VFH66_00620 [Mycobacteriales bacterium]|nr:hypothetical protein [Mycobacteriales bacterium]
MLALIVVAAVIAVAGVLAVLVDRRDRRQGSAHRRAGELLSEAVHHRVDIHAVPYEPARHAGQRDWATYRQRDRKRER